MVDLISSSRFGGNLLMEIRYHFEPQDIGPILRANGYGRNLRRFSFLLFLNVFPSMVVLWAADLADLVLGGFVVFTIFIAVLHFVLRRMAMKSCLGEANSHRLEVTAHYIHYSAPGRWFRFDGSWVTGIDHDARYLFIRRATQVGVVPLRVFQSPQQQQALVETLRRCCEDARDSPPNPESFVSLFDESADPTLATVEFEYTPAEFKDLEIHRFEPKAAAGKLPQLSRHLLSASLVLLVLLWLASASSSRWKGESVLGSVRRSTPAVAVILALVLPLVLIRPLQPVRRKLLGQLGDEERGRQILTLRRSGVSHGSDRFQSHLAWTHVQRILDGRDYIVIFGDLGGWSAVPQRVFATEDDAGHFAQLAERLYNDALNEKLEQDAPQPPMPYEDGNPYQSPWT